MRRSAAQPRREEPGRERVAGVTPGGVVLLADARSIVIGVDLLKARAKGMAVGLEPELSVVVDVFYPIDAITQVATEFRQQYPGVALRIYVEALGAAVQPVLDGRCSVGIIGPLPEIPNTLTSERFSEISFLMVAARDHPLTLHKGNFPKIALVSTIKSSSPTGRIYPLGASWALCRPPHGVSLTCLRSTILS